MEERLRSVGVPTASVLAPSSGVSPGIFLDFASPRVREDFAADFPLVLGRPSDPCFGRCKHTLQSLAD